MFIVSFTGHRPNKLPGFENVRASIRHYLSYELAKHPGGVTVLSGGALGVDTLAAEVALELRIPFYLILPFPINIFTARWNDSSRSHLRELSRSAKHTYFVQRKFSMDGYMARNRVLVDKAHAVCAVFNGTPGGTKNTVDYARSQGKALTVIRPSSNTGGRM